MSLLFCPAEILLKTQLCYGHSLCMLLVTFPLLSLIFFFLYSCHFNYNLFWCGPPLVNPIFDSLYFLYLDVCFLPRLENFSSIMHSNLFSVPFFSVVTSGISISVLDVFFRGLKLSSILLPSFFFSSVHQ